MGDPKAPKTSEITPFELSNLQLAEGALRKDLAEADEILGELRRRETIANQTIERANKAGEAGILDPAKVGQVVNAQFEILRGFQQRTQKLLKGEFADPETERISKERMQATLQDLERRGIDPNSTAGRRTIASVTESNEILRREGVRRELFGSEAVTRAGLSDIRAGQTQAATIAQAFGSSDALRSTIGARGKIAAGFGELVGRRGSIALREFAGEKFAIDRRDRQIAGIGKAIGTVGALAVGGGFNPFTSTSGSTPSFDERFDIAQAEQFKLGRS